MCLILEHDRFRQDLHLSDRRGSEMDTKAAQECFSEMGFDIFIKKNLRYSEISRLLEEIAGMDHSRFDCFALVLLRLVKEILYI